MFLLCMIANGAFINIIMHVHSVVAISLTYQTI